MRVVEPDAEPARRLMSDYLDELGVRQAGSFDRARYVDVDPAEFEPPAGVLMIAYDHEQPVACGGVRLLAPGVAEIKRMYVPDEHRGHGYARALLAALEDRARAAGYRRMILETGDAQPEALALYTSSGYTPIPGFGIYRCAPQSKSFAKALPD